MVSLASELVRDARLSRQLTMTALAALAGVPASTVSRIESGKTDPTMGMLSRLMGAAGFAFESLVADLGDDQPFADALDRLEGANDDDREAQFQLLPDVAGVAPVASRRGLRRVAAPADLSTALAALAGQGQHPVVSGMEAFAGAIDPQLSFVPIVYVDDPAAVEGFAEADEGAYQVMLLLPATDNVRARLRVDTVVPMMVREWGLLDAMASPGRQGDIARDQFQSIRASAP
ncbi:MAG: helix-turn-helix domain-containing protein [Propionibacteriaceae bacterium]|jgi:transcriptional regulator with XRE-family HTH domain|nr:helix-turn-helix domain-containing protein [Propionibacteriaceae bacterium]